MRNSRRPPLLSDKDIEEFNEDQHSECVDELGFSADEARHFASGHIEGMNEARSHYEAARAKDADLIQDLVDRLKTERLRYSDIVDMLNIDRGLAAANELGFKPTP